jgi:hypothetical protein
VFSSGALLDEFAPMQLEPDHEIMELVQLYEQCVEFRLTDSAALSASFETAPSGPPQDEGVGFASPRINQPETV